MYFAATRRGWVFSHSGRRNIRKYDVLMSLPMYFTTISDFRAIIEMSAPFL
uniref:AlNc14C278G10082 protein n=1 Tax=Albugo laibachii Nc14 TaxID=890382 RepID=F0WUT4_9STRA|nr:AlNc14C278G10082 [Albugo laibachii Nc14]|eukprot:CCA25170.1 AlNc14C278G10082 [Albugo laibachii Nc14]